jgi:vesicle-fusing ATPase
MTWDRPVIAVEMGQPTTAQRASLWHSSLGQGTTDDAKLLAEQYPLAPALIVRASEAAKARANGRALEPDDIYAGIRSVLDDRLGQFAKRVTVTQTWDDLVLPPDQLDTIVELMARVRGRSKVYEQWGFAAKVGKGLGVSALFSGPPGTGKTMVAALIARDLGLELYQVDMGKLVSKFIGETEKNLGALFDAAEAGHAILLFDEADSLFGKRTDVKSSNDRYANLETNYLLQRLESFTGICLLTTNHDSHIDPAFQRRLSLHLRFELPDVDERAQLWRATLPVAAPLAGNVDFGSLARRYAMSGGYIRNAALRAAFLAADEDSEITAAHLERAARVEYEGMGKIAA